MSHIKKDYPNAETKLKKHEGLEAGGDGKDGNVPRGYSAATKSLRGFLGHFAAWIVDENLSFSTGKSMTLKPLFRYLEVTYALLTHTTVRNELARLYADLHGCQVPYCLLHRHLDPASADLYIAGTITSFISDDWELIEHLVDFSVLEDKQHEGV
ncbi:hypothetical protein AURDEDRAFT_176900 [Auricularia subglabra TFB-10046 SS5]|uniref:Uncharacterized protein n=1 Tax=Auricularia subglabra (strain TFB-10046 / SS5) TaxID=717982 RepID=J0LC39_AURST|nr:hypothetical protein AURDEDRAFT_176900 [Auricularia subglabra TFB-10046 SS5]